MSLTSLLRAIRYYWWLVALLTIVGAAGMFGLSRMQTPVYGASADVFVSVTSSRGAQDLSQGATFVQSQVASYADLATMPYVLNPVASRMEYPGGAAALGKAVKATSSRDTVIISITARDTDPARSAQAANEVAAELGTAVRQLSPRNEDGHPLVQVATVSQAAVPTVPVAPETTRNTALGLVSGLFVGLLAAVAVDTWPRWSGRAEHADARRTRRATGEDDDTTAAGGTNDEKAK